jgi:ribosome biogenesis ATPase
MPNARPAKLRGGVSSSYVTSDPLLLPRVEAFARSSAGGGLNALRDVDACAQYLRSQYRQYARKPVNPFRKAVERAMAEARARGRCDDGNGDDGNGDDGNGDDEKFSRMDGEGSSDHEDSDDSETSTSEATSSDGTSDENGAIERDENGMDGGDEAATTAAFAAPEVVAAAAQRALKLEAEAKASASGSKAVKEEESAHERAVRAVAEAKSRGHEVKLNERGMKIERLEKSKDKKRGKKGKGHRRKRKGDRDSDSESLDEDEFGRTTSAKAFAQMTSPRSVKLSDLGGIEDSLKDIKELILCPLMHPELYAWLGVDPPRGVLLHGPPGCGKTTLAHAIAQEAKVPFFSIAATEIVSGMSGESEAKIRELFQSAAAHAPSLIFIDEIDAIVPKRESAQREMERRIVAQLLASMDDLQSTFDGTDEVDRLARCRRHVTVIGATNRPDGMDAALRRAGRFDREIMLGIPDEAARERILRVQATKLRLNGDLDLREIAKKTPGYVGADLSALAKEAAASAVTRIFKKLEDEERASADVTMDEGVAPALGGDTRLATGRLADPRPLTEDELEDLAITMEDFSLALTRVQPSAQREGFTTTPNVTWDDVGSLTEIREELKFSIAEPIAHPERFQAMGLNISTGVLLYGPPGCGKTLVAKATANEAMANFISIKGPELLNKYVGESERAVRTLFQRARSASPCVLFFDEMDSLAPRRGSGGDNTSAERVVNQLLTEMDGLEARNATFLIAATNRPDMIDPAMLRPGRLDKLLYVPLPPPDGRVAILKTLTRRTPIAPDVRVDQIALGRSCEGFSGADLAALVREACVAALKSMTLESTPTVTTKHFEEAFTKVQPSVSKSDHARYDELRRKLRRERGTINSARRSSSAENLAAEPASNKRVRPGDDDDRDDRDAPELATS